MSRAVRCLSARGLTDTGQALYPRGMTILQEFKQLEAEISDINELKNGELRLGIPPMVGMQIANSISAFRQRNPGVVLRISEFSGLTVQRQCCQEVWTLL